MEWTKEQREQAARVILQREHELWPLLERGEQGPYILYVLRNRTNEVTLQLELTAALDEIERLKSEQMGELAVGKSEEHLGGGELFRCAHCGNPIERRRLTPTGWGHVREEDYEACGHTALPCSPSGELAVGGADELYELVHSAKHILEDVEMGIDRTPQVTEWLDRQRNIPAPPSGEQAAAPLENESETPNA